MEKLAKSSSASRAPSISGDNTHSRNDSNSQQQSSTLTRTISNNNSNNNTPAANNNTPPPVVAVTPPQSLQPQLEPQQENGSGGGGGEEYEILCNEMVLPLTMTLAAVRQFVWKQSSELVMHYRRKRV